MIFPKSNLNLLSTDTLLYNSLDPRRLCLNWPMGCALLSPYIFKWYARWKMATDHQSLSPFSVRESLGYIIYVNPTFHLITTYNHEVNPLGIANSRKMSPVKPLFTAYTEIVSVVFSLCGGVSSTFFPRFVLCRVPLFPLLTSWRWFVFAEHRFRRKSASHYWLVFNIQVLLPICPNFNTLSCRDCADCAIALATFAEPYSCRYQ